MNTGYKTITRADKPVKNLDIGNMIGMTMSPDSVKV